ncbi:MAG: hypothetical protein ACK518_02565 [bacterium]
MTTTTLGAEDDLLSPQGGRPQKSTSTSTFAFMYLRRVICIYL